ncbi:peptidase [Candidatus Arthromitus sp. SFB-mouse-Japan]|uniref:M23 family metallopeptidase n=1 Tax=Candidatus Arthromitus sp. SFB-mouse TaxID=49118 RepID=UPI00021B81B5|nr:M23 family metallopeptidase [Candidatus Arthromitus sp. SFB-mouse]EIA22740.1 Peptidase M23 [Candidatus Arthromitus sp. SFB-1]EIA26937.1 Putative metalloendopeptidase [Candidatus Arthromitus sp. SFB-4]EIA28941.1 Putative Membrane-located metalloendopeptidase [Candidatus Arthromitus sp. SFB-co]EIA29745.1 Membrane protein metalloendopeptidase [Candidatus Arthromitus sp. SFB-mouse-SU]EGX28069.1 M23/M37 family peptidase [Candidatus Arthromitus sp. SFB-mouse-NYU]
MHNFKGKINIGNIIFAINIIFIILILYLISGKTLGYVILVNGNQIGVTKNKKIFNEYYEEKLHNNNIKSQEIVKMDSLDFKIGLVNKIECLSVDETIKILDENLDFYIKAYSLFLGDKKIANIDNRDVFNNVKKRLFDYYIGKHNLNDIPINWIKIKEKVEFSEEVLSFKDTMNEDQLYDFILSNNENNNILATVEIVASKTFLENIEGNKVQIMKLYNQSSNKEKIYQNGFDREVVREITYNNDKYVGMKKVSTKMLRSPLNEVQNGELFYLNNPSKGNVITSPFGLRWGGEKHHGIDIAGDIGDPIFAAESGFANLVSYNNVYGNYMKLNHGKGVETLYGHCDVMFIKEGEYVKKGQIIGEIGNTGRSTGPHLHFEVRVNGKADNPLNYVAY